MRAIDVSHLGREHVICAWQVDDVIVDPGPESTSDELLDALGDEEPRALLLTHIHFDHAGAAGALVRAGRSSRSGSTSAAPVTSSIRRGWSRPPSGCTATLRSPLGRGRAGPAANIRVLRGGEREEGWEVAYTPGHASHHVSYRHLDSGWVFAGDTAGVRMPPGRLLLAPTPPPEFDLEYWLASIDTLEAWEPQRLAITHFGDYGDVFEHLDRVREALTRWTELAGTTDRLGYAEALRAELNATLGERDAASFEQAMPPEDQWLGIDRYLTQLRETGAPS